MRSIVFSENGSSAVLGLVDREPERPRTGEVRVRIAASAVNPTDWQGRRGLMRPTTTVTVPNQDGAGVVDEIGPGVTEFQVGDRVWTNLAAFGRPLSGTAQELTVLPVCRVYRLPRSASFDVGASLGIAGITAHRALTVTEGFPSTLSPGSLAGAVVLVAGGAGAVGNAAIQLACWAGATVLAAVSSPQKAALATAAGASHVLDYRAPDAVEQVRAVAPNGVHTVVDVAAGTNIALDSAVLGSAGTIVSYANGPSETLRLDMLSLMNLNARVQFIRLFAIPAPAFATAVEDLTNAAEVGGFRVGADAGLPLRRFSLEQTGEAHDAVENGLIGKAIIDVADL